MDNTKTPQLVKQGTIAMNITDGVHQWWTSSFIIIIHHTTSSRIQIKPPDSDGWTIFTCIAAMPVTQHPYPIVQLLDQSIVLSKKRDSFNNWTIIVPALSVYWPLWSGLGWNWWLDCMKDDRSWKGEFVSDGVVFNDALAWLTLMISIYHILHCSIDCVRYKKSTSRIK